MIIQREDGKRGLRSTVSLKCKQFAAEYESIMY